jgi:hypothetical protein
MRELGVVGASEIYEPGGGDGVAFLLGDGSRTMAARLVGQDLWGKTCGARLVEQALWSKTWRRRRRNRGD